MERIAHYFYSDLFNSHIHLPTYQIPQDGYVVSNVLPSEIRHAILSVQTHTAPGSDKVRPKHLKNMPLVLVSTLAQLITVSCPYASFHPNGKPAGPFCCTRRETSMTSAIIAQSACFPSSTSCSLESSLIE